MKSNKYQQETNDDSNRDHLANERCMMFFDLRLHKRIQSAVNLGHCSCPFSGYPDRSTCVWRLAISGQSGARTGHVRGGGSMTCFNRHLERNVPEVPLNF